MGSASHKEPVDTTLGYAIGIDTQRPDTFIKGGGHLACSSFLIFSVQRGIGVWASVTAGSSFDLDERTPDDAIADFAKGAFDEIAR